MSRKPKAPAKKQPYYPFYIGDWKKNNAVQSLSVAAKGLLIQLVCVLHESESKGYLTINGQKPTLEQIARLTACKEAEVKKLMAEMKKTGALSQDKKGRWFLPFMVEREKFLELSRINGQKGGNPGLKEKPAEVKEVKNHTSKDTSKSSKARGAAHSNVREQPELAVAKSTSTKYADIEKDLGPLEVKNGKTLWNNQWWYPGELQKQLKLLQEKLAVKRSESEKHPRGSSRFAQCLLYSI